MSNQRLLSVTIKPEGLDEFTENPQQFKKGIFKALQASMVIKHLFIGIIGTLYYLFYRG